MAVGLYSGVSGLALGIGLYRNVSGLWGGASGLINGFGGADPYAGASLYLNFLSPPLDSRITFSRGTNATLIDSTGRLTYAPNNLLTWSEDFSNAAWTKTGATVTANAAIAPDGTLTADQVVFASGTSEIFQAAGSGGAAIGSVWVKGTAGQTIQIYDAYTPKTPTVLTGDWQRLSVPVLGAIRYLDISAANGSTARTIFLWGAQLEAVTYQTTPSTYVATTASAYYGPRFDYDPVTLAPRGLLIEEARTNLATYSDDFGNAAWVKVATTVSTNVTPSPDGTANADRLVSTAATAQQWMDAPAASVTTGVSYAFSVYAKASQYTLVQLRFNNAVFGGAEYATFNLANGTISQSTGSGHTITNAGNGWYRCTVIGVATATTTTGPAINLVTNPTGGRNPTITGDGTSGVFLYGAQLEAGSFATSYIPTVASTVTRNADVATMTGTNFSSWYNQSEGTFVAQYAAGSASFNPGFSKIVLTAGIGSDNNFSARIGYSPNTAIASSNTAGVNQASFSQTTVITNYNKVIMAYKTDDFGFSVNGSAVATDTSGSVYIPNSMSLGQSGNTYFLNGWIATIAYFNTRLPNAQLQTLTAPSLATTLSLDFTSGSYNVGF